MITYLEHSKENSQGNSPKTQTKQNQTKLNLTKKTPKIPSEWEREFKVTIKEVVLLFIIYK